MSEFAKNEGGAMAAGAQRRPRTRSATAVRRRFTLIELLVARKPTRVCKRAAGNPGRPPEAEPWRSKARPSRFSLFTLIELLVVIAVILLLVAMLLPALSSAKEAGRQAVCRNNLKQLADILLIYNGDFDGMFPPGVTSNAQFNPTGDWYNGALWWEFLYNADLLTVVDGFGTLGGGSSLEYSRHGGFAGHNSTPSLLCPSGEDKFNGDTNSDYSFWGRFIHAAQLRDPMPISSQAYGDNRVGYLNVSYTVNGYLGTKRAIRFPDRFVMLTDLYTYSGSWPAHTLLLHPNGIANSMLYGFQRHSTARPGTENESGRMFVLHGDGHVGTVRPRDAYGWASPWCSTSSEYWRP